MPHKKLLTITIYEDIDMPYEIDLIGQHLKTIEQTKLYEVIRQVIAIRLETHHQQIQNDMKKQGAIKYE